MMWSHLSPSPVQELARLRKTESRSDARSAFPGPSRSLAPEPPARRGVSGVSEDGAGDV